MCLFPCVCLGFNLCLKVLILHHRHYDTLATGIIYFHRFYMFHSFKQFPRYVSIYNVDDLIQWLHQAWAIWNSDKSLGYYCSPLLWTMKNKHFIFWSLWLKVHYSCLFTHSYLCLETYLYWHCSSVFLILFFRKSNSYSSGTPVLAKKNNNCNTILKLLDRQCWTSTNSALSFSPWNKVV